MPYQFNQTEPPEKAVRRICHERIAEACARLRRGGRPGAIHGVRKEIKKLRAVLRLVRDGIGEAIYRPGTKSLREVAHRLAGPRDARVMLKTFAKLAGRNLVQYPGLRKALRKHARQKARRFRKGDLVARAARGLRKADRRVRALKIQETGWAAIEPGLQEGYRRGRSAQKLARREPSPENFHAWRKQVKDLWHYFRLLRSAWPTEVRVMTDELEKLGEHLGDDHDLTLLKEFVNRDYAGHGGETRALNRLIESRQKHLRAAALRLGVRLYAETTAEICRRLEQYFKTWQGEMEPK